MSASAPADRPGLIEARPVRHPWRWVALTLIAIVLAMIISSFVTNERWDWSFAFQIMNQTPVLEGLWKGTIVGTVGAMLIGVGLGVVIAIMRLSENPVLKWVAFAYTWFFRAIPRYVLLSIIGSLGYLYSTPHVGLPFGHHVAPLPGPQPPRAPPRRRFPLRPALRPTPSNSSAGAPSPSRPASSPRRPT